ncbi:hypothetical protein CKAN_01487600 [Cinnamomum micranthum f. kanehirae]|uniref:Uncharacterized protein n=1 Tax=Cinnamomum micranthum f. kanehirae TaxID=337451 RepID=A0A3S3QJC3_9MAGN|nr:hypothetical protein CKAN_01487600 [Cinnamomum micranthum f. kanehirae]
MASIPPSSIRISHFFPSILLPKQPPPPPQLSTRAIEPNKDNVAETESSSSSSPKEEDGEFENRLSRVRLKYRSGTGKKAEIRKAKKSGASSPSRTKGGNNVFLPPIPLKEPVSGGMKVDFGFSPFTERLNGRLAGLGLAALLLVELGSGKSLLSYHTAPILFIQIYFVASVSALFIKYEKEKTSIWPKSSPSPVLNEE